MRTFQEIEGREGEAWAAERPNFGSARGRGRPRVRFSVNELYDLLGGKKAVRDLPGYYDRLPDPGPLRALLEDRYGGTFASLTEEYLVARDRLLKLETHPGPDLEFNPGDERTVYLRDLHDSLLAMILRLQPTFPSPSVPVLAGERDVPLRSRELVDRLRQHPTGPLQRLAWIPLPGAVQFRFCDFAFTRYAVGLPDYRWTARTNPFDMIYLCVRDGDGLLLERFLPPPCERCAFQNWVPPCTDGRCSAAPRNPFLDMGPDVWLRFYRLDSRKRPSLDGALGGHPTASVWTPGNIATLKEHVGTRRKLGITLAAALESWNQRARSGPRLATGKKGLAQYYRLTGAKR